jgi:hypothetical protein
MAGTFITGCIISFGNYVITHLFYRFDLGAGFLFFHLYIKQVLFMLLFSLFYLYRWIVHLTFIRCRFGQERNRSFAAIKMPRQKKHPPLEKNDALSKYVKEGLAR